MGHLFMFLCELIIASEFLLFIKIVDFFFCKPIHNYQLNERIFMILYQKKNVK